MASPPHNCSPHGQGNSIEPFSRCQTGLGLGSAPSSPAICMVRAALGRSTRRTPHMRPRNRPCSTTTCPATHRADIWRGKISKPPSAPARVQARKTTPSASPGRSSRRRRLDEQLRQATAASVTTSLSAWTHTRLGGSLDLERLTHLLADASDLVEDGVAPGTRDKDALAYDYWVRFAEHVGFAPDISASDAAEAPELVTKLLAAFLMYVYPRIRGRGGRQWAKPRSAMAYPLAIVRLFGRMKVPMPTAKVLKAELQGLTRRYVARYGKAVLAPRRQQPMLFSMVQRVCELRDGRRVGKSVWSRDSDRLTRTAVRILRVGWRTGHRLGECVRTSSELTYFVRSDVAWRINGVMYADPTDEQLAQLVSGRDCAFLSPCRSKTDVGGIEWSPFPSVLPYDASKSTNAAAALLEIEQEEPCHGARRDSVPLYADAHGQPYTHGVLDGWLHRTLAGLYDDATASVHSWHSLRIGLACALAAARVPDAHIQLICRWASEESLKTYRRLGVSQNVAYTDAAERAVVDTMQSGNIPIISGSHAFAMLQEEAVGATTAPRIPAARPTPPAAVARAPPAHAEVTPAEVGAPAARPPRLVQGLCVGRRVCVPRRCWPNYACRELSGRGWAAHIGQERCVDGRPEALVCFDSAVDNNGRSYAPVWLALRVLSPI